MIAACGGQVTGYVFHFVGFACPQLQVEPLFVSLTAVIISSLEFMLLMLPALIVYNYDCSESQQWANSVCLNRTFKRNLEALMSRGSNLNGHVVSYSYCDRFEQFNH